MAGGRGLSVEEKRVKLLEIFRETKDFFTLKELEKLGQKKGVVSQTVKDVLQTLVDDNLVELDKIGISNFYWSFPSARGTALVNKVSIAAQELATLEKREIELKESIVSERALRPETGERDELLSSATRLKDSLCCMETELIQFTNSGGFEGKKRSVALAKDATIRYTDNLSIVISYISRNFSMPSDDVRQMGGIPEDFEDLDLA